MATSCVSIFPFRTILAMVTILLIAFFLLQPHVDALTNSLCAQSPKSSPSASSNPTALIPRQFSRVIQPGLPAYDWASKQTTSKGGFLWVRYNTSFEVSWEVSMLHSLHCLNILRAMLQGSGQGFGKDLGKEELPAHVIHCMDYIAQVSNLLAKISLHPLAAVLAESFGLERICSPFFAVVTIQSSRRRQSGTSMEIARKC
jgi:hypothetical protein